MREGPDIIRMADGPQGLPTRSAAMLGRAAARWLQERSERPWKFGSGKVRFIPHPPAKTEYPEPSRPTGQARGVKRARGSARPATAGGASAGPAPSRKGRRLA